MRHAAPPAAQLDPLAEQLQRWWAAARPPPPDAAGDRLVWLRPGVWGRAIALQVRFATGFRTERAMPQRSTVAA